ncbi:WD40-repeat-containing domain protein [Dunaliella salina]|uniref:WD40-repeat-containing domain protein n=1 Tax=Dunaliella salina TaxID=3046 RepID=A0ABQ7FYL1_DUNSA|nr:WD40-repeat-containing domain protein [Dunaliella salina]|eukprot:KAF5827438.1 WD40-repeat-containing domain protein [Dunaliella salina]
MSRIQEALQAPGVMLPDARLEVLLEQALTAQVNRCPFHNGMPETSLSLLTDYQAGAESLPSKCVQVLDAHSDEVWHVVFSHSGTMLASASKDKTVILWSVRPHTPSSSRPAGHNQHPPSFRASPPSAMAPPSSSSIPSTSQPLLPPFSLTPPTHGFTTSSTFTHAPIPPPPLPTSTVSTGPTPLWTLRPPHSAQQQQQQQQQQRQSSSSSDVFVPVLQAEGVLRGHDQPVAFVTWSPDDQLLLTVSDEVVRLWQVSTGRLLHTFTHHREAVSCCAWMPDSKSFLSGSVDKTIIMSDVKGHELQRWKRPYRVQDMAVTHNGALLIVACSDKQIHILRLSDGREVTLQEEVPITSISLSPDSSFLLTALQSHVLRLWHLGELAVSCAPQALGKLQDRSTEDPMDTMVPSSSVAEYHVSGSLLGQPGRYVLRSAFGGAHSSFVVHGSEDCLVYLWHRDSSELLLQLEGHSATVNACSWNPTNPHLLVSASDDRTIRVWMSEASLSSSGHR